MLSSTSSALTQASLPSSSPQAASVPAKVPAPVRQRWFTKSKNTRLAEVRERLLVISEHTQRAQDRGAPTTEWSNRFAALEQHFSDFEAECRARTSLKRVLKRQSERQQVVQFQVEIDTLVSDLEFEAAPRGGWFEEATDFLRHMLLLE